MLSNYTVTDKADGQRKMLFVSSKGRIYLISTDMSIAFTGSMTQDKTFFNSLVDGEHIIYGKPPESLYINLYACFDLYFLGGKDYRANKFVPENEEEAKGKFRLPILQRFMTDMNS